MPSPPPCHRVDNSAVTRPQADAASVAGLPQLRMAGTALRAGNEYRPHSSPAAPNALAAATRKAARPPPPWCWPATPRRRGYALCMLETFCHSCRTLLRAAANRAAIPLEGLCQRCRARLRATASGAAKTAAVTMIAGPISTGVASPTSAAAQPARSAVYSAVPAAGPAHHPAFVPLQDHDADRDSKRRIRQSRNPPWTDRLPSTPVRRRQYPGGTRNDGLRPYSSGGAARTI